MVRPFFLTSGAYTILESCALIYACYPCGSIHCFFLYSIGVGSAELYVTCWWCIKLICACPHWRIRLSSERDNARTSWRGTHTWERHTFKRDAHLTFDIMTWDNGVTFNSKTHFGKLIGGTFKWRPAGFTNLTPPPLSCDTVWEGHTFVRDTHFRGIHIWD